MSQNPNTPESKTDWNAQFTWVREHWRTLAGFAACALLGALIRNWLDVSKSYQGVVATAVWNWGFILLLVINFVFVLIAWYILTRFLTFSRKMVSPFPLQVYDFVMVVLAALLLPMFLSMDLKLSQALSGASELGVQDTSERTLQSTVYQSFTSYATNTIFTHVDPKIRKEIQPIIDRYGCENGVASLRSQITFNLNHNPDLVKGKKDSYIEALKAKEKDTELTVEQKVEDMARIAIEAFDLDYVKSTFRDVQCPTTP